MPRAMEPASLETEEASVSRPEAISTEGNAQTVETSTGEEIAQEVDRTERRWLILSFWAVVLLGLPWWWQTTRLERLPLPTAEIHRWKSLQPHPLHLPLDVRISGDADGAVKAAIDRLTTEVAALGNLRQTDDAALEIAVVRGIEADGVNESEDGDRLEVSDALTDFTALRRPLGVRTGVSLDGDARAIKYAHRVKLVFSLLHQDNAAEHSGGSPGWAFKSAFEEHIMPLLKPLSTLHQFSVETQIQHFAPLSFEPERLEAGTFAESVKLDPYGDRIEQPEGLSHLGTVIEEDQLKAFVNSADWPLASAATNDSILHFLLFVPTPDRRPMLIRDADGELLDSTAFLVPQWGGVVIANPTSSQRLLSPAYASQYFSVFAHQLKTLLGVPEPNRELKRWQVEAMTRGRALEAAREAVDTLAATEQLAREVTRLRIGEEVREEILSALEALRKAKSSTDLAETLQLARSANEKASRAFFHPSMMGILYFPDEHLYAIYLPLFGPIAVPLVGSVFKEIKAYRKRKAAAKLKTA